MSIFNESTIAQMPLISILLAFLGIWMVTFLVLALRSTTKKSAEQAAVAAEPAQVGKAAGNPALARQVVTRPVVTNEAANYVSLNEQEVAQVAGAAN